MNKLLCSGPCLVPGAWYQQSDKQTTCSPDLNNFDLSVQFGYSIMPSEGWHCTALLPPLRGGKINQSIAWSRDCTWEEANPDIISPCILAFTIRACFTSDRVYFRKWHICEIVGVLFSICEIVGVVHLYCDNSFMSQVTWGHSVSGGVKQSSNQ